MKDSAHHMRHIQRKVIRSARQNGASTLQESATSVNAAPQSTIPALRLSEPKRSRQNSLPRMMKAQSYH
jgi:hypothetical protein